MPSAKEVISNASFKETMLSAIDWLIRPLAEIAVRSGISAGSVCTMFERACVDVAMKRMSIKGKRNSITRVSLLTGIDRKKVTRFANELKADESYPLTVKADVISTILSVWHTDPRFINEDGLPRELSKNGSGNSLSTLIKEYGRDTPVRATVEEMLRSESITEENGFYLPLARGYFPKKSTNENVNVFGTSICDLLETTNYNLFFKRDEKDGLFQRSAQVDVLEHQVPEINSYIHNEAERYLHNIDNYLTIVAASPEKGDRTVRLGIGIYQIDGGRSIHDD